MDQLQVLKQVESRLAAISQRVSVLSGMLEDLLFRAQRMARALKDGAKAKVTDTMFGRDLQTLRRDLQAFGRDAGGFSSELGGLPHPDRCDGPSQAHAQAVMRISSRLHKRLGALLDQAVLAHRHIPEAENKVEAWVLVEELVSLAQQAQAWAASSSPASSPGPTLRLRAALPLRPVGRLLMSPPTPQQL